LPAMLVLEEVLFLVSELAIYFLFYFRLIRNIEAVSAGGAKPSITASSIE
jgi:hypothetical protein